MADEVDERLRGLLKRKVEAAAEEALESDGPPSAKSARAISSVARLIELYESRNPPPLRRRWPLVFALVTTFLIVSMLVAFRVPETEIELDASLSELGFRSATRQKLTESIAASALSVSGLQQIDIPRARGDESRELQFANGASSGIRLEVLNEAGRQGSIDLEPLLVPAATQVWLRGIAAPGHYRLSVTGAKPEIRATVFGPIRIALANGGIEHLDFVTPKLLVLYGHAGEVSLDLTFLNPATNAISPQLEAAHLTLLRVDEANASGRSVARHVSTISSGTLYLESLNGQKRVLRASEVLQFERAEGEIRALRLQPDHSELRFHGRVRGMTIGAGENRRSLMPTWLEWLKERHGLSLFWGTAVYLFGLVAAVLRWMGRPL